MDDIDQQQQQQQTEESTETELLLKANNENGNGHLNPNASMGSVTGGSQTGSQFSFGTKQPSSDDNGNNGQSKN